MANITKDLDAYDVDMAFEDDVKNSLSNIGKYIPEFPTIFKSVETYFDTNMNNIIEEWGLLLETDLNTFDIKLRGAEKKIGELEKFSALSEKRTKDLEKDIKALELKSR